MQKAPLTQFELEQLIRPFLEKGHGYYSPELALLVFGIRGIMQRRGVDLLGVPLSDFSSDEHIAFLRELSLYNMYVKCLTKTSDHNALCAKNADKIILELSDDEFKSAYKVFHNIVYCSGRNSRTSLGFHPDEILELATESTSVRKGDRITVTSEMMLSSDSFEKLASNHELCFSSIRKDTSEALQLLALVLELQLIIEDEFLVNKSNTLLALPPFGYRGDNDGQEILGVNPRDRLELQILQYLENPGRPQKAAFLVPNGFLSLSLRSARAIRQLLVESGLVGKVMQFPAGLYAHIGIPCNLLILSDEQHETVTFIDTLDCVTAVSSRAKKLDCTEIQRRLYDWGNGESGYEQEIFEVPYSEIIESGHSLQLGFYRPSFDTGIPDHSSIQKFGQVLAYDSGSALNLVLNPDDSTRFSKVAIKNLKGHETLQSQTFDECEAVDLEDGNSLRLRYYSKPVLLVSSIVRGKVPCAYFEPKDNEVIAVSSSQIMAFAIDTNDLINPEWLLHTLQSERTLSRIKDLDLGAAMPRLTRTSFLEHIDFILPPRDIQEATLATARSERFTALIKDKGLEAEMQEFKDQIIRDAQAKIHTLGNTVFQMTNTTKMLTSDIEALTGDTKMKAEKRCHKLTQALLIMETQVEGLYYNDSESVTGEVIDLMQTLNEWSQKQDLENVRIVLNTNMYDFSSMNEDGEEIKDIPELAISKIDFETEILGNILGNAMRHGFTDPQKDYILEVRLSPLGDDHAHDCLLELSNNGNPLPDGVDTDFYCAQSLSAGANKNKGIGGASVCSAVRKAGGKIEVVSDKESNYPVSILVYLPLAN